MSKEKIIAIDDSKVMLLELKKILSPYYELFTYEDCNDVINNIKKIKPSLILLDVIMPNVNGFDLINDIKAEDEIAHIPVIFLTGLINEFDEEKGLKSGAADYIMKPLRPAIVLARVRNQIEVFVNKRKLEEEYDKVKLLLLENAYGKKVLDMLYKAAYYDELTKILNRSGFRKEALKIIKDNPQKEYILIRFDIYQFKAINDLFGFDTADHVLKNIAKSLSSLSISGVACFARIHADGFLALYEVEANNNKCFQQLFEESFYRENLNLFEHKITFQYGRYFIEKGENSINDILQKVNLAHIMAKQQKHSKLCDYDENFKRRIVYEAEVEDKMHQALANKEFVVYLQPKYMLKNEKIAGAEALVRWQKADKSIISPGQFIPLFEKNGFITKLDFYMLERVCELLRSWIDDGKPVVAISINFSRLHLLNNRFVEDVEDIVNKYSIPKKYIELELTESTIINNEELLQDIFQQFHENGFCLSIDDFGTGYSSLGLLKNLCVDVIKMDKSFFDNNKYEDKAKTVILNVMNMARQLGVHTVAEGVETQGQINFLKEVKCDIVQGYYYAKPMPTYEFEKLMARSTH